MDENQKKEQQDSKDSKNPNLDINFLTDFFVKSTTGFWQNVGEAFNFNQNMSNNSNNSNKSSEQSNKPNEKNETYEFGSFMGPMGEAFQKNINEKFGKAFGSTGKILKALILGISQPDNINAFLKSFDIFPDIISGINKQIWEVFFELQTKYAEQITRFGQKTKTYNFEDIDKHIFKDLKEIYQNEISKFLNIPQIGLTRFYQERFNIAIDKFNVFQGAISEFIYMFYVPIEKSFVAMQEEVEQMLNEGKIHTNFKDYYSIWIKILEGHYMTLLKSQEYTKTLDNTIKALADYKRAKEDFLEDILKQLPIPTNKEMDQFYKEFYILKKRVRELEKELKNKHSQISQMSQNINKISQSQQNQINNQINQVNKISKTPVLNPKQINKN